MNESLFILKQCTFTPSPIGLILQFITQILNFRAYRTIKIFNSHTSDTLTIRTTSEQ